MRPTRRPYANGAHGSPPPRDQACLSAFLLVLTPPEQKPNLATHAGRHALEAVREDARRPWCGHRHLLRTSTLFVLGLCSRTQRSLVRLATDKWDGLVASRLQALRIDNSLFREAPDLSQQRCPSMWFRIVMRAGSTRRLWIGPGALHPHSIETNDNRLRRGRGVVTTCSLH